MQNTIASKKYHAVVLFTPVKQFWLIVKFLIKQKISNGKNYFGNTKCIFKWKGFKTTKTINIYIFIFKIFFSNH